MPSRPKEGLWPNYPCHSGVRPENLGRHAQREHAARWLPKSKRHPDRSRDWAAIETNGVQHIVHRRPSASNIVLALSVDAVRRSVRPGGRGSASRRNRPAGRAESR
jgi:hypothetical protein